jgi:segregation and condensation protein B
LPGRPELLGTTRDFLDYFGLKSLDDLPPLAQLRSLGEIDPQFELPVGGEDEVAPKVAVEAVAADSSDDDFGDSELSAEADSGEADEDPAQPRSSGLVAGPADDSD